MNELKELKLFAEELAMLSGKLIKQYWRTNVKIENKADESPVTIADKKAEELMRELIMKQYPDHGILGEEFGEHNSAAEYKWILDPIDGTKSFICGTVTFGTLIALVKNNELLGTDYLHIEKYQSKNGFDNLMRKVKYYRMWGDCYGYYLVATGFADIMIDPIMNPWDSLAVIPVIGGAGGRVTDYKGNDAVTGASLVATAGQIHDEVIRILNLDK